MCYDSNSSMQPHAYAAAACASFPLIGAWLSAVWLYGWERPIMLALVASAAPTICSHCTQCGRCHGRHCWYSHCQHPQDLAGRAVAVGAAADFRVQPSDMPAWPGLEASYMPEHWLSTAFA